MLVWRTIPELSSNIPLNYPGIRERIPEKPLRRAVFRQPGNLYPEVSKSDH